MPVLCTYITHYVYCGENAFTESVFQSRKLIHNAIFVNTDLGCWLTLLCMQENQKVKISTGFSPCTNPCASYYYKPTNILSAWYLSAVFFLEMQGGVAIWTKHHHDQGSQLGFSFSKQSGFTSTYETGDLCMTQIYLMHARPTFDPILMRVLLQVNSLSPPFRDVSLQLQ